MAETASLFTALGQYARPEIAQALRQMIETAPDAKLARINPRSESVV